MIRGLKRACFTAAFLSVALSGFGLLYFLFLGLGFLFLGIVVFAFLHYRYALQEEFAHVLAAAADVEAPLAPAVRAYLAEIPRAFWRELLVASVLLLTVAPLRLLAWVF